MDTVCFVYMVKAATTIQRAWLFHHPRCCPICMDLMDKNSGCVDTPCNHKFCLKCYLKLEDPHCPMCRTEIPVVVAPLKVQHLTTVISGMVKTLDVILQHECIQVSNVVDGQMIVSEIDDILVDAYQVLEEAGLRERPSEQEHQGLLRWISLSAPLVLGPHTQRQR